SAWTKRLAAGADFDGQLLTRPGAVNAEVPPAGPTALRVVRRLDRDPSALAVQLGNFRRAAGKIGTDPQRLGAARCDGKQRGGEETNAAEPTGFGAPAHQR